MKQAGELNPGGMAAILKLSNEVVEDICQQVVAAGYGLVQVANYNAPDQVVISGHNAAVEQAIVLAQQAKARKIVKLPVSIATHSPLMQVVVAEFQQTIQNTPLNLPEIPIVANITAKQMTTLAEIQTEMAGQLTASVRWSDSIQYLISQGVTHFLEIGPKKVLTSLLKVINKEVVGYSVQMPDDLAKLLEMRQD
jgi:[acyl-carrier-protein] S-malonyltransferase